MTIMGSFGGFFLKKSTENLKKVSDLIKNRYFYIGGVLYFFSALLNIYLLKYIPYVIILPLTSITYIWTLVISCKILNEKVNKCKMVGVFFIGLGVFFISKI